MIIKEKKKEKVFKKKNSLSSVEILPHIEIVHYALFIQYDSRNSLWSQILLKMHFTLFEFKALIKHVSKYRDFWKKGEKQYCIK